MKETIEGRIKLILPGESIEKPKKTSAFYNPRMTLNRDFSIAAANTFFGQESRLIKVCEPLAASGVRALRYAKEVRNTDVICADIKRSAYATIVKNIEINNLKNVRPFHEDAEQNLDRTKYDLIDIDPFGTPAPFLEDAIRQTNIGGLLGVTATDMPVLCGVYPEVAKKRYGGRTLRVSYCYELGARVLIYAAAKIAEKYKKSIEPLMVLGVDHYVRIWLGLTQSKGVWKRTPPNRWRAVTPFSLALCRGSGNQGHRKNYGYIYHCFSCDNRKVSKQESGEACDNCGKTMEEAGPLWAGPIFNDKFLQKTKNEVINSDFQTKNRALKLIEMMEEEAAHPELVTFYDIHKFCKTHNLEVPKTSALVERLRARKFQVVRTHFDNLGIRTNAGVKELKDSIKVLN